MIELKGPCFTETSLLFGQSNKVRKFCIMYNDNHGPIRSIKDSWYFIDKKVYMSVIVFIGVKVVGIDSIRL